MGNSTIKLQDVVDFAKTFPEIVPCVGVGGYANQPALTIANDVMTAMLSPTMNWKFNRMNVTPFYTISWQQDYAQLGLTNLGWIEHCWIVDINNTQIPKPVWTLEDVRDLERSFSQFGRPGQICWLPNDQLTYGIWGATSVGDSGTSIGNNPAAGSVYTNPLGQTQTPSNPVLQIKDTNGNYDILTSYGQAGALTPAFPAANSAAGTTFADGSATWTVVEPKGTGFRLNPIPPQSGVVYQVNVVAQMRPPTFTSLTQVLDPIPDDFSKYFREGFVAMCYDHSPESEVRAKGPAAQARWMAGMVEATKKADRERDAAGFFPTQGVMDNTNPWPLGPAWPYPPNRVY